MGIQRHPRSCKIWLANILYMIIQVHPSIRRTSLNGSNHCKMICGIEASVHLSHVFMRCGYACMLSILVPLGQKYPKIEDVEGPGTLGLTWPEDPDLMYLFYFYITRFKIWWCSDLGDQRQRRPNALAVIICYNRWGFCPYIFEW
jgi:hypothetical protein